MKLKSKCCKKFKKKPKTCSRCPLAATLCKKERKKLIKKYAEKRAA